MYNQIKAQKKELDKLISSFYFFYNVIITIRSLQSELYEFTNVAAQTKMQKIIQNPLQRRTCIIMSCFVEFVHPFDRFFYFINRV